MASQDAPGSSQVDFANLYGESDVSIIKQALISEQVCPEILQYQEDLVQRLESQISNQEATIQELNKHAEQDLLKMIYTVEVQRVKYSLRCYLRARLKKLEQHVMHCLDDPEVKERLSEKEVKYAEDYFLLLGQHISTNVLSAMPQDFKGLLRQSSVSDANDTLARPNLDTHVFCKVLEDQGNVEVDDNGDTVDFSKDDLYIVRYRPIRDLVRDNWVQLI
ncbi:hypothetical protein WJX74_002924 [Apatococcus lobatus]|uniref:DNA replication complex GINS protein SLD5 n=2 Tax=Apatococcus TaxID=904362 RepID=A0AAW1T6T5_9CHLO